MSCLAGLCVALLTLPAPGAAPGDGVGPRRPEPYAAWAAGPHAAVPALDGGAQDERDAWFAQDKMKHMVTSLGLTLMGYGAVRATGFGHRTAAWLAVGTAAAAGVAKEIYDRTHGRPFSLRDLAWDAVGVLIGASVVDRTR